MTTPVIDQAKPAGIGGVRCEGYGRKPHIVTTRVFRVKGSTVYLCWDCLYCWTTEQPQPVPTHRRAGYLGGRVLR